MGDQTGRARSQSVYPRVCGVDVKLGDTPVGRIGLSPRVRGRSDIVTTNRDALRFIPACAG